MSIVYLSEPGLKVKKDGGKFIIVKLDGTELEMPSGYVDCFVVLSNAQFGNKVIKEMLRTGRQIIYLDHMGRVLGSLGADNHIGRVNYRQLKVYEDEEKRGELASFIVREKLKAQKKLLDTYNKSFRDIELKKASARLEELAKRVQSERKVDSLMGFEGVAAQAYYSCFSHIIVNMDFEWLGRKKHPAPDPVNAMLSFGYFLLEKDVRITLAPFGLLTDIGVLHEMDFRKESLIYDLMEPFRPAIVDRIVLKAINLRKFSEDDFIIEEGRCLFTEPARRRFIAYYEENVGCFGEALENLRCQINAFAKVYCSKLKALVEAEETSNEGDSAS